MVRKGKEMISKDEFVETTLRNLLNKKKTPSFKEKLLARYLREDYNWVADFLVGLLLSPIVMILLSYPVYLLCTLCGIDNYTTVIIITLILTLLIMGFRFLKGAYAEILWLKDVIYPKDIFLEGILKRWGICYERGFWKSSEYKILFRKSCGKVFKVNGAKPFYFQQRIEDSFEENYECGERVVQFHWRAKDIFEGKVIYYDDDPDDEGNELNIRHPVLCKGYHFIVSNKRFVNLGGLKKSLDRAQKIADAFKIKYEDCLFCQKNEDVYFDVRMTLSEAFWDPVWAYSKKVRSKEGLEKLYNELTILQNLANGTDNAHDSK